MTENNDGLQESRFPLAVLKTLKQVLKGIEGEPALVIESDDGKSDVSEETLADIRAWLFKGRQENGDADN